MNIDKLLTITCALQIALHYQVEMEFAALLERRLQCMQEEGLLD